MNNQTVIYPGTFDPITKGHLDIIQRVALLFPKVIVAVAKNPSKQPLLTLDERVNLVTQSVSAITNVTVVGFEGLLVDLAKQHQIQTLIRGIRGSDDIEYEIQLSQLNHTLSNQSVQTIFIPPALEWRYLSSTMVREIYRHQGDIRPFVPDAVYHYLNHQK